MVIWSQLETSKGWTFTPALEPTPAMPPLAASGSCGLLRLPRPTSPTLCHDLSLCHHSWGFPTSWGNPQQLDGFCEGKSHLEMDDGWGYPRKPPKETAAPGWSKTVLICLKRNKMIEKKQNHTKSMFDDWNSNVHCFMIFKNMSGFYPS